MKRILFIVPILVIGIAVAYYYQKPKEKPLPVLNPMDLEIEMVDQDLLRIGQGHTIGNFAFRNQENRLITQKDVIGKVYVVEYFFTTCGTICPKMNAQMQRVQKAYNNNSDFKILSFTVNPEVDSVQQMKLYANGHKANPKQWYFLTGNKDKLYALARRSFFLLKPAEAVNQGDVGSDFIHTNNFVLIDRKMRIRAYYDGTSEKEVSQLISDVERLLNEE